MINIVKENKLYFEFANKRKNETGLDINVYFSIKPKNKKDNLLRVKIQNNYSDIFMIEDSFEVVIFDDYTYKIITKVKIKIKNKEIEKVIEYVKLNKRVITDYWNGLLSSDELKVKLIKI